MLSVLYFLAFFAVLAVTVSVIVNQFTPQKREARAIAKSDRLDVVRTEKALTAERQRSTIAQNALREIAAGNDLPVFVASDALSEINKTYTKEIQ